MSIYLCRNDHKHRSQNGATNCGYCRRQETKIAELRCFMQSIQTTSPKEIQRHNGVVHKALVVGSFPTWAIRTNCGALISFDVLRPVKETSKHCKKCFKKSHDET